MIAFLLAVSLGKLVFAALWGGTADIAQTFEQAQAFLAGRDVFDPSMTGGTPAFFPLGHYGLAALCVLTAQVTGMPFAFLIKTPAIVADLAVSLLLRAMPQGGNRAAVLYMLNPVTFLLSVYHGQLHTVGMAGTVLALWFADQGRCALSGLTLGLATSVRQHYALLLVPLVMRAGTRRRATIAAFALTGLLINVWLLSNPHVYRILSPTWNYGAWGYTMLLLQGPRVLALFGWSGLVSAFDLLNRAVQAWGSTFYLVWAVVFGAWVWRHQGATLWHAALLFLVGLYAISPGFGVQWLVWAVPFWLIVNRRDAIGYSLLAGAFLAGSYWQWGLNATYGVWSLTANLHLLAPWDLVGVLVVGILGMLTWAYSVRATLRLARA